MCRCPNAIGVLLVISLQSIRYCIAKGLVLVLDKSVSMLSVRSITTRSIAVVALFLIFVTQAGCQTNSFSDRPLVAPQIRIERQSIFRSWPGGEYQRGLMTHASSSGNAWESAETKATVVGVRMGQPEDAMPALLVKTPFGLTGWRRRDVARGSSSLDIYLCN